jgi:Mg2+/Co2+ transporter CorB
MNIAFFLTPKSELVYINMNSTMRQALEKLEHYRYTAIPLVNDKGEYAGTLTEGALLWTQKKTSSLNFNNTHQVLVSEISLHRFNWKAMYIIHDYFRVLYRQIQEQSKQLLTSFLRLFHLLDKNGRKSHRYRKKTVFDILSTAYEQHIEK